MSDVSNGGTSVATDSIRKALDHLPPSCIRIKARALNDLAIIEARMKADQDALSAAERENDPAFYYRTDDGF